MKQSVLCIIKSALVCAAAVFLAGIAAFTDGITAESSDDEMVIIIGGDDTQGETISDSGAVSESMSDIETESETENNFSVGLMPVNSSDASDREDSAGTLDTYVDEVLIPQEGLVSEGEYLSGYTLSEEGWVRGVEHVQAQGVLSWILRDFDGDARQELLVLILGQENAGTEDDPYYYNAVYLRMYEQEGDVVSLKEEMLAFYPVLGYLGKENSGIFLVEHEGQIYICGSQYDHGSVFSDGISYDTFVVTYENGSFVTLLSETAAGSDFSGDVEFAYDADKAADFLEGIGLEQEAAQIRESLYVKFDFNDEKEELLLQITGDYSGFSYDYYSSGDISDAGKILFTVQTALGETQNPENSESSMAAADLAALYADVVLGYEEKYGQADYDIDETPDYQLQMTGVYFLKLLDFDQDGTEELMIGYVNTASSGDTIIIGETDSSAGAYGLDIWGSVNGEPVQLYSRISDYAWIRYTSYDGEYYLYETDDSEGEIYKRLSNGSFQVIHQLNSADSVYTVDGQETDWSGYRNLSYVLEENMVYYGIYQQWRPSEGFFQVNEVRSILGLGEISSPVVASGTCGENVTWVLNEKGILCLSGSGDMADFSDEDGCPWEEYREDLRWAYVDDGVTSLASELFMDCTSLTYVRLPEGITEIPYGAFRHCNSLCSVNIPSTVESIAMYAFMTCYNITSITMPANLKKIGTTAFYYCTSLSYIRFTGDAPDISENAFTGITATVIYPADNSTWTSAVRSVGQFDSTLTWEAR